MCNHIGGKSLNNNPNSHAADTSLLAFDARTQRVLELRRQISEGTYVVDDEAVAAAMLREHLAIEGALSPLAPNFTVLNPTLRDFSRFLLAPAPRESEEAHSVTAIA